jgi:capsular polysaccharide biosynthesis protein
VTEGSAEFFSQFSAEEADIRLIDPPTISQAGRSAREQLDLPLRIALALTAGVALAFLLHYLDDSVRERADLEKLGVAVLGEVPRS